jgi:hypothetical protein
MGRPEVNDAALLCSPLRWQRRRGVGIREALESAPDELERVEALASRDDSALELTQRLPAEER